MDLGLKNKTAFIAASSQGLGKAVAMELALEGVNVIINGRHKEKLERTKSEIESRTNKKVIALSGDLSVVEQREQVIASALQVYDGIDILVTNSGGPPSGKFESFKEQDWDNAYHQLVTSTVGLLNGFLPGM